MIGNIVTNYRSDEYKDEIYDGYGEGVAKLRKWPLL
jgi:hypothetical protein